MEFSSIIVLTNNFITVQIREERVLPFHVEYLLVTASFIWFKIISSKRQIEKKIKNVRADVHLCLTSCCEGLSSGQMPAWAEGNKRLERSDPPSQCRFNGNVSTGLHCCYIMDLSKNLHNIKVYRRWFARPQRPVRLSFLKSHKK